MRPIGIFTAMMACALWTASAGAFETDSIDTSAGKLEITFIGHGTLVFEFGDSVIHVDPWTKLADYSKLKKAGIVLITHHHGDHLDTKALDIIRTPETKIVCPEKCGPSVKDGIVMKNGDTQTIGGLKIEAVPAYNIVHMRSGNVPYHPKGEGNGYVVTFGDKRVYVAGDTENIPEMKDLKNIDIAFLPMNLPYTMAPKMVADAAKSFSPKILYPYHYGDTDTLQLASLLKNQKDLEIRIRKMK